MKRIAVVLLLIAAAAQGQNNKLTIVSAGPVGEVAKLAEANEVRVVFSEPMVVVGKIPQNVNPPWFHIDPAVQGGFRWSGTTTLIFTPSKPLPFATKFTVRIDPSATSVAGNKLDQAYEFSFITPTIRLRSVDWYRKGGFDSPIVIALRFNQPVEAATVVQHLQLRTLAHDFTAPTIPEEGRKRLQKLEPQGLQAFAAKVAKAQQAASSNGQPVLSFIAADWDKKRFKPGKDLVVIETKPGVLPDTNLQVYLDSQLAKADTVRVGSEQQFTIELGPTLFVDNIDCVEACDPESRNYVNLRTRIGADFDKLRKAVTVTDVTDPAKEVVLQPQEVAERESNNAWGFSLDELGYSVIPAHNYAIRIDPSLETADGQKLGYTYMAVVEYWHRTAFTSFGDGHGVWEATGGPLLPFHARNFRSVKQWLAPLKIEDLMPTTLVFEEKGAVETPPGVQPTERKLTPAVDKIQSYGFNLKPAIGDDNLGLVWAAVQEGEPLPKSRPAGEPNQIRSTLVQATNLGITVKDSPQNTLVMVTRLEDAKPVAGATVTIRTRDNKVFWSGTTDARGIAIAPNTDIRRDDKRKTDDAEYDDSWQALSQVRFLVTAEKDGDVAYVVSNWNEGIQPWDFGTYFSLAEATPMLRGTVFTDRGVYKLGEEVHVKAVIRSDTPEGMKLLPAGTNINVELHDSHDKVIDKRAVPLNEWSSAEWTVRVPEEGALGNYFFTASVAGQRLNIMRSFLVAAYRRPDFRVDVTLGPAAPVAGAKLDGKIVGRYLFGGAMGGQKVRWTYSKTPAADVPAKIRSKFPEEQWVFLGWDEVQQQGTTQIQQKEEKLNAQGELKLSLATNKEDGWPFDYSLEGEVTDVSRQAIANRTSLRVHPAPWYIGLNQPPYFADTSKGFDTQVIAASLDGVATPGVEVKVELFQLQWVSSRKSEGGDFYEWEGEIKRVPAGNWTVTTAAGPAPLHVPIANGGEYELVASANDAAGHSTRTRVSFYAVGAGYTAWERYDHNRIDLVPEKKLYKPGDTARILVKSPWEKATALLTTEREGVRTSRPFELTSTQQTITVPVTDKDIPNVFVSVLLLKGRTKEGSADAADPGKPAFRLGYTELKVEDASKRLKVDVKADRDEFRPAAKAKIDVTVKDVQAKPVRSEVTLWAVDYGVLSLTGYQTPDVMPSVWIEKALQVATEDSREKIVSRRVLTPKGADEGGGGGRDAGPGVMRKDFRVLAFWLGSITTDKNGRAHSEVTLPES
ncbi:MAG TPA: MG2 domain-containing protein, partial [Thermoanaerobaculia bacterium]|nr:MG2 domain-containing protein [Thermoanaerobaculia bacterium]